jgi:hypothetical protein
VDVHNQLKGALILVRDHKDIQRNKCEASLVEKMEAVSQKEVDE